MIAFRASSAAAAEAKVANAGLRVPSSSTIPLCHGSDGSSRKTNQMNILMLGSAFASASAVRAYDACVAYETPRGSSGFVSWLYSVIQIGVLRRPKALLRAFSKAEI